MIKIKINGRHIAGKRAHYGDINHIVNVKFVSSQSLTPVLAKIFI